MVHSGYPQRQAVAASLSNARRHPRARGGFLRRPGGGMLPYDPSSDSMAAGRVLLPTGGQGMQPQTAPGTQGGSIAPVNLSGQIHGPLDGGQPAPAQAPQNGITQAGQGLIAPANLSQSTHASLSTQPTSFYAPPAGNFSSVNTGIKAPAPAAPAAPTLTQDELDYIQQQIAGQKVNAVVGGGTYGTGGFVRRDDGGQLGSGLTPSIGTQNPLIQSAMQRYQQMPVEKLQELASRMGGTQQGQLVQRVLQQKRMMPPAQPSTPTPSPAAQPQTINPLMTAAPQPQGMEQQEAQPTMAEGGMIPRVGPTDSFKELMKHLQFSDAAKYGVPGGTQINAPPYPANQKATGGLIPRRPGGGPLGIAPSMASPWWERSEERGSLSGNTGFLHGSTPGRADSIKTSAPAGSYIVPADVVAGWGEGNSIAGARAIQNAIKTGPWGTPLPPAVHGRGPPRPPPAPRNIAKGGGVQDGPAPHVPVMLSHGEFQISPEDVRRIGNGNIKHGHDVLDHFVMESRQKQIKKLKSLPGPAK